MDTSGLSAEVIAATQFLTRAINSTAGSDLFNVEITNNNPDVAFGDSGTRAGVNVRNADGTTTLQSAINIRLDFADDEAIMGNAEAKASFLDFVFAHEVSHFYPFHQMDPTVPGVRGDVDNPVNEIRQSLGRPLRSAYQARPLGPLAILRFGNAVSWQEGCLQDSSIVVARGSDGIEVSKEGTKAIFWVQRVVKSR